MVCRSILLYTLMSLFGGLTVSKPVDGTGRREGYVRHPLYPISRCLNPTRARTLAGDLFSSVNKMVARHGCCTVRCSGPCRDYQHACSNKQSCRAYGCLGDGPQPCQRSVSSRHHHCLYCRQNRHGIVPHHHIIMMMI